jgi:hypothetical protein
MGFGMPRTLSSEHWAKVRKGWADPKIPKNEAEGGKGNSLFITTPSSTHPGSSPAGNLPCRMEPRMRLSRLCFALSSAITGSTPSKPLDFAYLHSKELRPISLPGEAFSSLSIDSHLESGQQGRYQEPSLLQDCWPHPLLHGHSTFGHIP